MTTATKRTPVIAAAETTLRAAACDLGKAEAFALLPQVNPDLAQATSVIGMHYPLFQHPNVLTSRRGRSPGRSVDHDAADERRRCRRAAPRGAQDAL